MDTFHSIDSSSSQRRVRVRTDKKTGRVVEVVEKVRLGDLNVFCPGRGYDWRLSVSVEIPGELINLERLVPEGVVDVMGSSAKEAHYVCARRTRVGPSQ